jgi:hypothetical protein
VSDSEDALMDGDEMPVLDAAPNCARSQSRRNQLSPPDDTMLLLRQLADDGGGALWGRNGCAFRGLDCAAPRRRNAFCMLWGEKALRPGRGLVGGRHPRDRDWK